MAIGAKTIIPDWHVGSDNWLEHILEDLWPRFTTLCNEIKNDAKESEPKSQAIYKDWLEHLTTLNPDASIDEIDVEARLISRINTDELCETFMKLRRHFLIKG